MRFFFKEQRNCSLFFFLGIKSGFYLPYLGYFPSPLSPSPLACHNGLLLKEPLVYSHWRLCSLLVRWCRRLSLSCRASAFGSVVRIGCRYLCVLTVKRLQAFLAIKAASPPHFAANSKSVFEHIRPRIPHTVSLKLTSYRKLLH